MQNPNTSQTSTRRQKFKRVNRVFVLVCIGLQALVVDMIEFWVFFAQIKGNLKQALTTYPHVCQFMGSPHQSLSIMLTSSVHNNALASVGMFEFQKSSQTFLEVSSLRQVPSMKAQHKVFSFFLISQKEESTTFELLKKLYGQSAIAVSFPSPLNHSRFIL